MKGFNVLNDFQNLKFKSSNSSEIESALSLLKTLGYSECESGFNVSDVVKDNGFCAWDDGELTEGWLDIHDGFNQVTLEDLKEMVGECERCDSFMVSWEKVFGEKFADSVYKAVKQNKDNAMKKDSVFTLERLLGCEVKINSTSGGVNKGHISKIMWDKIVFVSCGYHFEIADVNDLTFFTEDGDELTFDEYVQLYYPKG